MQRKKVKEESPQTTQAAPKRPAQAAIKQLTLLASCAVALAVLGGGYGIWATLSTNSALAAARANTTPTLVAGTNIKAGDVLSPDMVTIKDVPGAYRVDGAVENSVPALGKRVLCDIAQGAQLTATSFAGTSTSASLAAAIAADKVAVTLTTNAEMGFAGQLRQGDYVAGYAREMTTEGITLTDTVCAQAKVIALDGKLSGGASDYNSITLETTASEAMAVRRAQAAGNLDLILLPTIMQGGQQ